MDCKIPAELTNGKDSNIYNILLEVYSGDKSKAKEAYSYFRSPKFLLEVFGNYADALEQKKIPDNMMGRLDEETFEPKLFYNRRLAKYYFIDKEGSKVYYPYDRQGLRRDFTTNEIKEFAKTLAFTYYNRYLTFDLETLEFNQTDETIPLGQFIEEFINEVGEELHYGEDSTTHQISLGGSLLDSADFIKEWEKEVTTVFNSFKLDVVSEEEDESTHMREREEATADDLVRVESFLKDSKDNVNNNIKLYLSLLQTDKTNMFGQRKFVEFGDIYSSLNKTLTDLVSTVDNNGNPEDLFEIYKEKINQLSNTKPYFADLYKKLDQADVSPLFRNQIVSAFRLSYNNFLGSELSRDEETGDVTYDVKNLSEVGSRKSNLLKQWHANFQQKHRTEDGKLSISKARFQRSYDSFIAQRSSLRTISDLFEKDQDGNSVIDILVKDLKELGVNFTSEGKLSFRDLNREEEVYRGVLLFLDNLNISGNNFSDKLDQIDRLYSNILRGIDRVATEKGVNNLFADQTIFTTLAGAEAFFQEEGTDASIFTVGKTKWAYSLPSYLSEKINSWKKKPELLFAHFKETPYNRGSYYMKFLLGIDNVPNAEDMDVDEWRSNYYELALENLAKVELDIFNSAQVKGDAANAKDSKAIGEFDLTIDYLNKLLGFRVGKKLIHKTAIAADKSTEYQIHFGNGVFKGAGITQYDTENSTFDINASVINIMYGYFVSEYNRMQREYDKIEAAKKEGSEQDLINNYHKGNKNALKSQLFPSLSIKIEKDPITKEEKIVLPDNKQVRKLYDPKTGRAHLENLDAFEDTIKQVIKETLSDNILDTYVNFIKDGVFVIDHKGDFQNIGLDSKVFKYYVDEFQGDTKMAIKAIAGDVLVNSIISQVEYSKMFTGDVAYYKDMVDYKKRVPATYTDGLYVNVDRAEDVFFSAAVVDSIEIPAPNIDKIAELVGEEGLAEEQQEITNYYRGVNAADAQAWITPKRWRYIKRKLGKWSNAKDEPIYKKLSNPEAEFTPEELKRLAQPLKGVYFDIVDGAPRYLKYSQAVLVPKLIANTPLQKLYDRMMDSNDPIDEVITRDGMKVGAQGVTTIHDENGNILEDFKLNSFQLTNAGWKLQQDLSPKGFKDTEVGSQIMKIIFQGLSRNGKKNFQVGDTEMTGDELIDYIHEIVSEKSNRGLQSIFNRFGIDKDTYEIKNEAKLYAALVEDLMKRRDSSDNTIGALLAETSPYGIPGQYQIFQNVFSSAVNKATIKISTNGGSFIQMSDFGLSKTEATDPKAGIRFTPWFNEPDGKLHSPEVYKDADGNKRIKPGGVFISGSFLAKYVPNYRQLSDKELFGTPENDYRDGLIDKKILSTIVGYRIPNQGLPSNDSFQVMGILPEDSADTIVAYTGITTKTGSDFDIDKMYIMMPSYYIDTNIKDTAFKYIWDKFKGATQQETIDNFTDYLFSINDTRYSAEEIAEKLETKEGTSEIIGTLHRQVVDVILDPRNKNKKLVKDIRKHLQVKVTKLRYAEPFSKQGEEQPLHKQSEEVLNNKLIEAYSAVLTSPHAIKDIMKPIDEPMIENDIKNMYPEEPRKDMMDFDAYTDIKLKQDFKLGKAGLGQNVNALTDSVLSSMGRLSLRNVKIPRARYREDGQLQFDAEYSQPISKEELASYVRSYNKFNPKNKIKASDVKNLQSIKIDDSMKALINGFVDIAKDPYITRGGWTTLTNNVGLLLVRAGVHPFYINAFLGQPIIKEYAKFIENNESNTKDNTDNLLEQFLTQRAAKKVSKTRGSTLIVGEVELNTEWLFKNAVDHGTFSGYLKALAKADRIQAKNEFKASEIRDKALSDLTQSIQNNLLSDNMFGRSADRHKADYDRVLSFIVDAMSDIGRSYNDAPSVLQNDLGDLRNQIQEQDESMQIAALKELNDLIPYGKTLNRSNRGSKVTTDGKGKNIGSLIVANNYVRDILQREMEQEDGALTGFVTKLKRNGKDTFLNTMFKNAILEPYKIMRANPKYFLTASDDVVSTFNYISYRVFGTSLQNQELADQLEKDYQAYIMSGFPPLRMSQEEKQKLLKELPNKLTEMKDNSKYKDNALIDILYVNEGENHSFISMPNNKKSTSFQNTLTDSWRALLEEDTKFAEDLIRYSYLISGFNMSMNQFHDFIPYEWFNRHRFNSYLKNATKEFNVGGIDYDFVDQYVRHNLDSSRYVKQVFPEKAIQIKGVPKLQAVQYSVPPGSNLPHAIFRRVEVQQDDMITFDIDYGGETKKKDNRKFYILVGSKTLASGNELGTYVRTTKLGNLDRFGNKVVEYDITKMTSIETAESLVHPNKELKSEIIENVLANYRGIRSADMEALMVSEGGQHIEDVVKFFEGYQSKGSKKNIEDSDDPFLQGCSS